MFATDGMLEGTDAVLLDYLDHHRPTTGAPAMMKNPPHPGLTLRDDVLPALGLNVTQAAEQLESRSRTDCGCSTDA